MHIIHRNHLIMLFQIVTDCSLRQGEIQFRQSLSTYGQPEAILCVGVDLGLSSGIATAPMGKAVYGGSTVRIENV